MSNEENKELAAAEKAAKKEAAEAKKAADALEKLEAEKKAKELAAAKEAEKAEKELAAADKADKAEKKRLAAQAKIDDEVVPYDLKGKVIYINAKQIPNKGKEPRKIVRQYYCMAKI